MQDDGSRARAARFKAEAEAALDTMHQRAERHRVSLRAPLPQPAPPAAGDPGGAFGAAPPRAAAVASSKPRHSGLRGLLTQARRVITGRAQPDSKRRSMDPQPGASRRSLRASSHAYSASGTSSNGSGAVGGAFSLVSPSSDAGAATPAVNSHLTDRSAASSDGFEPPPARLGDRTSLGFEGDSAAPPPSAVSAERRAAGRGVRLSGPFAPPSVQQKQHDAGAVDNERAGALFTEPTGTSAASRYYHMRDGDGLSGELDAPEGEGDDGSLPDSGGFPSARARDPPFRVGGLPSIEERGRDAFQLGDDASHDEQQWERERDVAAEDSRSAEHRHSEASSAASGRSGGSGHSGGAVGLQRRATARGIPIIESHAGGSSVSSNSIAELLQQQQQHTQHDGLRASMGSSGLRNFSRRKQLPMEALTLSPQLPTPGGPRPHPLDGVLGPMPGPPLLRQQQQQWSRQAPLPDGGSGGSVAAAVAAGASPAGGGPPFSLADTLRRRQEQLRAAIPTPSIGGGASGLAGRPDSPHDLRLPEGGRGGVGGGRSSSLAVGGGLPLQQPPPTAGDAHTAALVQQLSATLDAHEASAARLLEQLAAARREADDALGALATRLTALETQLAPAWRASADAWLVEYEAGLRAREEELARSRARELRGDVAREVKRRAHHFETSLRTLEEKLRGLEAQSFSELASQAGATMLAFGWNGLVTVVAALVVVLGPVVRLVSALFRLVARLTGLANPRSATARCARATGAWCRNVASALCSCGAAPHAADGEGGGGESGAGASPTHAGGGKKAARVRSGSLEDVGELLHHQPFGPSGGGGELLPWGSGGAPHLLDGGGVGGGEHVAARAAFSRRRSGKPPPVVQYPPPPSDEPGATGNRSRVVGTGGGVQEEALRPSASQRRRPQLEVAAAPSSGGGVAAPFSSEAGARGAAAAAGTAPLAASAASDAAVFGGGGGGGLSSLGSAVTATSVARGARPPLVHEEAGSELQAQLQER